MEKLGRTVNIGARPLLIMWPFGPVALVYDIEDTSGPELPEGVRPFPAKGPVTAVRINKFLALMRKGGIECHQVDAGQGKAGEISLLKAPISRAKGGKARPGLYQMMINPNHEPPVQFATLAHELAHLFLGHLGPDDALKIGKRYRLGHEQMELEAESVSYLVCNRHGVTSNARDYLSEYVKAGMHSGNLDLYQIMRAAGQVEILLGINAHMSFK